MELESILSLGIVGEQRVVGKPDLSQEIPLYTMTNIIDRIMCMWVCAEPWTE